VFARSSSISSPIARAAATRILTGLEMVAAAHLPPDPPFDPEGLMMQPGFKVMHVQDLDYRSVCQPFTACLGGSARVVAAHPVHIPIFILVETKQESNHGPMHFDGSRAVHVEKLRRAGR